MTFATPLVASSAIKETSLIDRFWRKADIRIMMDLERPLLAQRALRQPRKGLDLE
jgi:hypothetical protein